MQQIGVTFIVIFIVILVLIGRELVVRIRLARSGVKVEGHITDHIKEGSYRNRKYYIAYNYDYNGSTYSRKERVSFLRYYMSDEFDGYKVSVRCLPDDPKIARLGYKIPDSISILPRQPLTSRPLPELSTSAIPRLKPSYHGSETSITGSVTLTIVHQSQDGDLRAKWIRDDFGVEYSCEGTITHEGTITLISTDSHGDSALRIHGSILPNGHLEGSLYAISKDGSSQRHNWSLA